VVGSRPGGGGPLGAPLEQCDRGLGVIEDRRRRHRVTL